MSAVCTCYNPEVRDSEGGEKFCKRCGHWWLPQHGSMDPATPGLNLQLMRHAARVRHAQPKTARNAPCPCGSGKKHKKCCLAKGGLR